MTRAQKVHRCISYVLPATATYRRLQMWPSRSTLEPEHATVRISRNAYTTLLSVVNSAQRMQERQCHVYPWRAINHQTMQGAQMYFI